MTMTVGVAALCGMTAFAQPKMPPPPVAPHEHITYAANEVEVLHIALMESKHDEATLKLLDKALADRKAMLHAEMERLEKQEAVVKAMKGDNKEELQKAREDLKGTMETVVTKAKAFNADIKAIREHVGIEMWPGPKRAEQTPAPKE